MSIPIESLVSIIQAGVSEYTELSFRESADLDKGDNGNKDVYLVLDCTNLLDSRGYPIVEYEGGIMRESRNVELLVSIYTYGPHKLERIIQAMKARDWLSRKGKDLLKESLDCVLVSSGAVATRDYQEFENGPWIRREGFDSLLRLTEVTETEIEMIEHANIKGADHVVTT